MEPPAWSDIAAALRYHILTITHQAGSGHPTSSMSAVDLMTVLFFKYFRADLDNFNSPTNDRLLISKGHASALFYSLFKVAGKITEAELSTYRKFKSPLEGHPTFRFPFTEAATGSLGQGLSIGAGLAWALKSVILSPDLIGTKDPCLAGRQVSRLRVGETSTTNHELQTTNYKLLTTNSVLTPRVFVLLGDGELAEGSNWEAAAWAAKHKLNNLIAVVDVNRFGQSEETMYGHDLEWFRRRFTAFGWGEIIIDGHNFNEIDAALEKALVYKGGPVVILGKTIKGKGVPHWEDQNGWHNKMLPKDELAKALAIYEKHKDLVIPLKKPDNSVILSAAKDPMLASVLPKLPKLPNYEPSTLIPTKQAVGEAIVALGLQLPELLVLDGDVSNSLHTDLFKKQFPDRFLQMYIAEQNMVGVAAGISRMGFKAMVNTFACFLTRATDQIRMLPLSNATVYFHGSYAGVSLGKDGPSQMGLEDLALFRSVYGSTVLYPADAVSAFRLTQVMLEQKGVVYLRTSREPTPSIYGPDDKFTVGGSKVFPSQPQTTNHKPLTIISAGITLHEALKAQKELAKEKIPVRVIDCYSVKPIDEKTLRAAAKDSKAILVVEDHYPEGGLGDAVRSAISDTGTPIYHLAVTSLAMSGTAPELLAFEEIDSTAIIKKVKTIFTPLFTRFP